MLHTLLASGIYIGMSRLEPNEYVSASRELFTNYEGLKIEYVGNMPVASYAVLTEEESINLAREAARLCNHQR